MAHTPLKMTIEQAHAEVKAAWGIAYSPEAMAHAVASLKDQPLGYQINIFVARMCFQGHLLPSNGDPGVAEIDIAKSPYHWQSR